MILPSKSQSVNPAELVVLAAKLLDVAARMAQPEMPTDKSEELLTVAQIATEFHTSLESLKAAAGRGEIKLVRGGHGKIMARRSDVVKWIESRPVASRLRKSREITAENVDPIDQMLARGELRKVGGR